MKPVKIPAWSKDAFAAMEVACKVRGIEQWAALFVQQDAPGHVKVQVTCTGICPHELAEALEDVARRLRETGGAQ